MPVYRVVVYEYYDTTVEEIHRAYRTDTTTYVYEIEAEDEIDARNRAEYEGTLITEDHEIGDYYESDFYEMGDELYSDLSETEFHITEMEPMFEEKKEKKKKNRYKWRL